jgi:antitoxin ParD1/3/4
MAKVSISILDDLLEYLDAKTENRSALIESLLKEWQRQKEDEVLAAACALVDELDLGWDSEWQSQAITSWEASGS